MSDAKKLDRRIIRTRQLLRDALMALVIEKGYETISVQEITDRANVNRSTFYLHYKDKDELLFHSMREMYDEIVMAVYKNQGFTMPLEEGEIPHMEDFQHVAKFADFYRVMLSNRGNAGFIMQVMDYLQGVGEEGIAIHIKESQTPPLLPASFIAAFCSGAEIGIVRWWLMNGMKESPEEVALMLYSLFIGGVDWALQVEGDVKERIARFHKAHLHSLL